MVGRLIARLPIIPQLTLKYLTNYKGARREYGRRLFFLIAKNFTSSVTCDIGPTRYYVSTSDLGVGYDVFLQGGFSHDTMRSIFRVLNSFGFSDFHEKTFVDVGANIGTTSIPALLEYNFARAIAFEPEPNNYRLLEQNIVANGVQDRIKTFNLALSDKAREAPLEIAGDNSGDHRIRFENNGSFGKGSSGISPAITDLYDESKRAAITIKTSTFDALVAGGEIVLDELGLVWVDTQGHEGHVLQGAQSLRESPVPVLIEFWPYGLSRMGGLEKLEEIIRGTYTHIVDMKTVADGGVDTGEIALLPASAITTLKNLYQGHGHTDLLLLKC